MNISKIELRILTIITVSLIVFYCVNELVNNPEPGVNQSPIIQPRIIIQKVDTIYPKPEKVIYIDSPIPAENDMEYDPNDPDADSIALEYPELKEDYED